MLNSSSIIISCCTRSVMRVEWSNTEVFLKTNYLVPTVVRLAFNIQQCISQVASSLKFSLADDTANWLYFQWTGIDGSLKSLLCKEVKKVQNWSFRDVANVKSWYVLPSWRYKHLLWKKLRILAVVLQDKSAYIAIINERSSNSVKNWCNTGDDNFLKFFQKILDQASLQTS